MNFIMIKIINLDYMLDLGLKKLIKIKQMCKQKYYSSLAKTRLFSVLDESQIKTLLLGSHEVMITKGQILFNAGDKADHYFFLRQGQVKLTHNSAEGREKILDIVYPGQLFAEATMFFSTKSYPVNCTALMDSELICFHSQQFLELLEDSPKLSMALICDLSNRLRHKVKEIELLSLHNANIRVANYLCSLLPDRYSTTTSISLNSQKKVIASKLSITPETFSRAINQMENQNLIEINQNSILIPDVEKLNNYVHKSSPD